MAIVNRPRLLIADEPTTGLDVITQRELVDLLQELRFELGLDVWLISHDLPLVASCCDDVAVMDRGELVQHGSAHDVIAHPTASATKDLVAAFPQLGQRFSVDRAPLPDSGRPALQLNDVTVRYRARRAEHSVAALKSVSLTVHRGERVALVGRSGAGKSTTFKLATGLVRPSTGTLEVLGRDMGRIRGRALRSLRRRIQTVFQDPYDSLHPGMIVSDIVAEPLVVAGVSSGEQSTRVDAALASVDLVPPEEFRRRHVGTLSGGQRQRVALARTLVAEPELILADEPTSMLDATLRTAVAKQLLFVQAELGAALVFITHDLVLAGMVADRLVVMCEGEVVEGGPSDSVLAEPQHPETARLLEAVTTITAQQEQP